VPGGVTTTSLESTDDEAATDAVPMAPPTVVWRDAFFDGANGPRFGDVKASSSGLLVHQPGLEGSDSESGAPTDPDGDPHSILWVSSDGARTWQAHVLDQFRGTHPELIGEANGTFVILADHQAYA
jgi:hypothetical protein